MKTLIMSSLVALGVVASAGAFAGSTGVTLNCSGQQTVRMADVLSGKSEVNTGVDQVIVWCAGYPVGAAAPVVNNGTYFCGQGTIHYQLEGQSWVNTQEPSYAFFCAGNPNPPVNG